MLSSKEKKQNFNILISYFGMLFLAVFGMWFIRYLGLKYFPVIAKDNIAIENAHNQINALLHVLLALSVVIVVAQVMGAIFKWIHQPVVVGEVLGGLLLGPSFLGRFAPEIYNTVLPPDAAPFLGVIAQLGVIFYMFLVGLEFDLKVIKRSGHATLAISHASIIFPFLLGMGLAFYLYEKLAPAGTPFFTFALFMGISMSITAFPVLARILTDRKVNRSPLGVLALSCAAVDDVTAWCMLAFVVSISQAKMGSAFTTLLLTIGYISFMFLIVRPIVQKLEPYVDKLERVTEGGMAAILVALLLSALLTELIGIHAIFGAFLLGAVITHNNHFSASIISRLEDLVRIIFLPAFFAYTGMRTQIGLLQTTEDWMYCGLIILVACVGKFGGAFIVGIITGLSKREAAAIGVLMNTRGLVELIVLNIGFDLHFISKELYTMLVIMALVTTAMTSPLFIWITKKETFKI